jgi:hypothetical protein
MLELALVGMFTAFLLAVVDPLISFLYIFISSKVFNAIFSLAFSALANWLLGYEDIKSLILWTVAGGFLGSALLALVERAATYRPTVVNPIN